MTSDPAKRCGSFAKVDVILILGLERVLCQVAESGLRCLQTFTRFKVSRNAKATATTTATTDSHHSLRLIKTESPLKYCGTTKRNGTWISIVEDLVAQP